MQAKVPRHGKNHVQEIFLCQKVQKGSNWGKMWHLQFQWKFVATSVLHHNLAPLIFVSVSTFIFVKKADRQKNFTLKHVIMKIGFHMYQIDQIFDISPLLCISDVLQLPKQFLLRWHHVLLLPKMPQSVPPLWTYGGGHLDWADRFQSYISDLFLTHRCSSIQNSKGYHPFSPLLFLLRSP